MALGSTESRNLSPPPVECALGVSETIHQGASLEAAIGIHLI